MTRYTLNVTHRNGGHDSSEFVSRPVMPTKSQLAAGTLSSAAAPNSTGPTNHPPSAPSAGSSGSKQSQQQRQGGAAGRKSNASKQQKHQQQRPPNASSPAKTSSVSDSAVASAVSSPVSASPVPHSPPSLAQTGGASAPTDNASASGNADKGKGKGKGKQQQRNNKKRSNPDNDDQDGASKPKRPRPDRKQAKKDKKKKSQICFSCRQPGHSIKECTSVSSSNPSSPTKSSSSSSTPDLSKVKCYLCGASKHTLKDCPARFKAPRDEATGKVILPYAQCFHCNETGHLAGQCPKNERGMYLNGGCCHICGSVQHLAKDCKPSKVEEEMATMVGTVTADQSADADDVFIALHNMDQAKSAKKAVAAAAAPMAAGSRKGVKKVVF
ncbi:hypothetical protein BCR44DRAFT_66129 [Catenaria anguillulae PL171]|uniref:CCHC-type domain-containing protein n=1 Tax=Catenaria anguillulae PL171 TaxID=765915 RepID=A0A1Y2HE47_9FUNG|nr:hypothetical protein BCR44DRAFT_66129 [Catenaria anguillulae PL171]